MPKPKLTAEQADIYGQKLQELLRTSSVKYAIGRAIQMQIAPECDRCGGCGRYSFNLKDGDRCYGCSGWGHVPPSTDRGWQLTIERAQKAAEDGALDLYLERKRLAALGRNATDRVMAAWKATKISSMYSWSLAAHARQVAAAELTDFLSKHRDLADINAKIADEYNVIHDLASKVRGASKDERLKLEAELGQRVEEAIAKIAVLGEEAAAAHAIGPATSKEDRFVFDRDAQIWRVIPHATA